MFITALNYNYRYTCTVYICTKHRDIGISLEVKEKKIAVLFFCLLCVCTWSNFDLVSKAAFLAMLYGLSCG